MRRGGPLQRRTPLISRSVLHRGGPLNPGRPLARESKKRAAQMRKFWPLKADYLAGHPQCEFPEGCEARATVVHHKRGRAGERVNDVDWFAASCDYHNEFAETQTGAALAIGWLIRIEGDAA